MSGWGLKKRSFDAAIAQEAREAKTVGWEGGSDWGGGCDQAAGSCCVSVVCSESSPQFCHAVSRYSNASLRVYDARKVEYLLNGG